MFHGKAEVSDLDLIVSEEDVGRFQVSVDNAPGVNIDVTIDDLVHHGDGFCFWDGASGRDEFGEVTCLA